MSFLGAPDPSTNLNGGVGLQPGTENCAEALTLLSGREGEIVLLAVEGRTDEQIAQKLGITTSTVNSYWVRIRGKVGPLSRTELVGLVLRHEARKNNADMLAENAALLEECERVRVELAEANAELRAARNASWHLEALSRVPEAVLVCTTPGTVVYANPAARRLFDAGPQGLEGLPLDDLVLDHDGAAEGLIGGLFDAGTPTRTSHGWDRPWYGLRRDGSNFRGVFKAERFGGSEGTMVVATVREIGTDVEALVASLRRPHEGASKPL